MKRTLMMTCLLAGIGAVVSLKTTVHAEDLKEDKAGAHGRRNRNGELRSIEGVYMARVPVNDASESTESKIQRGLDAAPVPLNLDGKDIGLAGLGSYIVNVQSDCNGCH